jgi:hypothetical protein
MRFMRSFKAGLALALVAGVVTGPLQTLQAAGPSKGFLSGEARAEAKHPYSDYAVRARNVADGTIAATAVLDTQGNFKLDGLPAGKMMVELTKVGQNKVICSEGPFDLKSAPDAAQAFGKDKIGIACNTPAAAWLLVGAAAAAGITAGVVATGGPAAATGNTPGVVVTPTGGPASAAQ